jgi:hypothetical protein
MSNLPEPQLQDVLQSVLDWVWGMRREGDPEVPVAPVLLMAVEPWLDDLVLGSGRSERPSLNADLVWVPEWSFDTQLTHIAELAGLISDRRPHIAVMAIDVWASGKPPIDTGMPAEHSLMTVEALLVQGWSRDGETTAVLRMYRQDEGSGLQMLGDKYLDDECDWQAVRLFKPLGRAVTAPNN